MRLPNNAQQFYPAFCGVLDLESLTLCYVNAGHNPPAVAIGGDAFQYLAEPINPFVGMVDGLTYVQVAGDASAQAACCCSTPMG